MNKNKSKTKQKNVAKDCAFHNSQRHNSNSISNNNNCYANIGFCNNFNGSKWRPI